MTYNHGVRVIEITEGVRSLTTVATAVIGLIGTAPDADATTFPLDTPVLITDISTAIGKAGVGGTLGSALQAISDQTDPILVVIRVAEGEDAAATTSNVIGLVTAEGAKTGLQAFLDAQSLCGVKPRIFGAPGLDAQPVTTALVVIAQKLRGFVYASAIGATVAAVTAYRQEFGDRELMLIWPDFKAWSTSAGASVTSWAVARAMGLRAKIDATTGFHKTLSNVEVAGVTGLTQGVHYDLQSSDNDAGVLNAAGVTTLIQDDGFRFWGSRTCAEDSKFLFESATRTAQVLMDTIADGLKWAVDKPLHPSLARDVVETINAKFRAMKSAGQLIGAEAYFDRANNSADLLAAGKMTIDYSYTPVPPLEDLSLQQHITDSYFSDFADLALAA